MIPVTPIKLIEMDHHEKASYSTVEQVRRPRRRRRAALGRAGRGAAGGPRGRGLAPGGQRRGRSNPRWTPATMAAGAGISVSASFDANDRCHTVRGAQQLFGGRPA